MPSHSCDICMACSLFAEGFGLSHLAIQGVAFVDVTHCTVRNVHRDFTQTGDSAYNLLIPLQLVEGSGPEFVISDSYSFANDHDAKLGEIKLHESFGVIVGDDAWHSTNLCDYRSTDDLRISLSVYITEITPESVENIAGDDTSYFPVIDSTDWHWAQRGRHWGGGASLKHDMGRHEYEPKDASPDCEGFARMGYCRAPNYFLYHELEKNCLSSCNFYLEDKDYKPGVSRSLLYDNIFLNKVDGTAMESAEISEDSGGGEDGSDEIDLFDGKEGEGNEGNGRKTKFKNNKSKDIEKQPPFNFLGGDPIAHDICPAFVWNESLHAYNAKEIDVDVNVVHEIWNEYVANVKPYRSNQTSSDDFCLVSPYAAGTETWDSGGQEARSDIMWYSPRNFETYNKYFDYARRLGIVDAVNGTFIDHTEGITMYTFFFIPRSFSHSLHYHLDWDDGVYTQVVTVLVPLNDFNIHLKYIDAREEEQDYEYKVGKAIGIAGGFWHATGLGKGDEEDVLLCVYLASKNPEIWDSAINYISDELEYYMNPSEGFVRNEQHLDKEICQ